MKLDYNFIKEILLAFEEHSQHEMECYDLWLKLGVMDQYKQIDKGLIDKYLGHIKVLDDNSCIESSDKNFGIVRTVGGFCICNARIRLTAQGYDFLDILKNDTAFNKVKNFAVSNAIDIGKQVLISLATGGLNG